MFCVRVRGLGEGEHVCGGRAGGDAAVAGGGLGSRHRASRKSQRGVPLGGVGPDGPL